VRGRVALEAEIFGRFHDAAAEERCPLSVNEHPPDDWIFGVHQPFRKGQTVARALAVRKRQHRQAVRLDALGGLQEFAAVVAERGPRFLKRAFLHHQRVGKRGHLAFQLADRSRSFANSGAIDRKYSRRRTSCSTLSCREESEGASRPPAVIAARLDVARVRRDRDAEAPEARGVILLEDHLNA